MDVTVVVCIYGNEDWIISANRAASSVPSTYKTIISYKPDGTLAEARNNALNKVKTEFICYLDADDKLEIGYLEVISEYAERTKGDIFVPSVRYVAPGRLTRSKMLQVVGHNHSCEPDCLRWGNWMVIGCVAKTQLIRDVGGWKEYPCYEDFDLWQRCWLAGAKIVKVPAAVYQANVRTGSRNKALPLEERRLVHYEIAKNNLPNEDWEYLRA